MNDAASYRRQREICATLADEVVRGDEAASSFIAQIGLSYNHMQGRIEDFSQGGRQDILGTKKSK